MLQPLRYLLALSIPSLALLAIDAPTDIDLNRLSLFRVSARAIGRVLQNSWRNSKFV
jgi:hypothetical protein